jgi:hypothetical protein
MRINRIVIILVLLVLGAVNIEAKRCNGCCAKKRCSEKEQNRLAKLVQDQQKEINMLRSKTIHLDADQMLIVYDDNNNIIGHVVDKFYPNLIGKNMRIVPRIATPKNTTVFYMDKIMTGIFISLEPGSYTSKQISLPRNSISSISIPEHLEVVLYSNDNFQGNSILVSNSVSNLVDHSFNDQTVSIEIIEKKDYTSCANSIGRVYYNKNFNGKSISLVLGANEIDMYQIQSIEIGEGYDIKVYSNLNVVDIIDKNTSDISLTKSKNGIYTFVVSKIEPVEKNLTIILYTDINYNGNKYYVIANNKTHFSNLDFLDGSISSLKIPEGLHLQIFDYSDFTGSSMIISGEISNLKDYAFNDRIHSFTVINASTAPKDQVILYSKPDFRGEKVYVPLGYTKCNIDTNDFNGFCRDGLRSMRASSIFVPNGYFVKLQKKPILWEEKTYNYLTSSSDIRNWIDSAIVSIDVKKI